MGSSTAVAALVSGIRADEDLRYVDAAIGAPDRWRAALGTTARRFATAARPRGTPNCTSFGLRRQPAQPVSARPRRRLHNTGISRTGRRGGCPPAATWPSSTTPGISCSLNSPTRLPERVLSFHRPSRLTPWRHTGWRPPTRNSAGCRRRSRTTSSCSTHSPASPPIRPRRRPDLPPRPACPHLTTRVDDGWALTYPKWVPAAVEPSQVLRHQQRRQQLARLSGRCGGLADEQLDVRRTPWRLHLFAPVHGIPDSTGSGTVAVMQVAHVLADGARASALAGWLFGRAAPVPDVTSLSPGFLPWRALDAARAHRKLVRDSRAGLLAPGVGTAGAVHQCPAGRRAHRAHPGAAPLANAWPHRHRSGAGRGVQRLSAQLGDAAMSWGPRCRWQNPVCHKRITTFAMRRSGCIRISSGRPECERIVGGPGRCPPPLRAPCGARGRPGVRRGARPAAALGYWPVRPRRPTTAGVRQHRGVKCLPRAPRLAFRRRARAADRQLSARYRRRWASLTVCTVSATRSRSASMRPNRRSATSTNICADWTPSYSETYWASLDLASASRVRPAARISSSCSSNHTVW